MGTESGVPNDVIGGPSGWQRRWFDLSQVQVLGAALLMSFLIGAVLIMVTELTNQLQAVSDATEGGGIDVGAILVKPFQAYGSLLRGAVGSPDRIASSISRSTPFIGAALALAFAFKAGLFNIGGEGQVLVGALVGGWAGTWEWVQGLPPLLAIPVVLVAGALGGAIWGGLPGLLKAQTGAHEVISTIMLNTIALRLAEYVVFNRDPVILLDTSSSVPQSRPIADAAALPGIEGSGGSSLHLGLLLAIGMCALMWFVMERTTTGFEINAVGLNPSAATYAGMSVPRTWILVMAVSGAFAGLAGVAEVAGGRGFIQPGVFRNIGFDSIAIALLARANPWAIIPAALLWGGLLSGAGLMQAEADLSIDLVRIVQALILLFVAADLIVRTVFRIKGGEDSPRTALASGWGG